MFNNSTVQQADLTAIKAKLEVMDLKLGAQINEGGISGFLGKFRDAFDKFRKWTQIDRILNALTLFTVLHNAAMLSRDLVETLGDVMSNGLAIIGLKDSEGSPIDVNELIGKGVRDIAKSILGEGVYNNLVDKWKKANRIYQSAANIVYSIRNIADSTREVIEWIAEDTGKIGNALKKWRVVGENAYKWMPERVTSQGVIHRKLDRLRDGLEGLEDTASSLSSVTGEVLNIREEIEQLSEQKQAFNNAIKDAVPTLRQDNTPVATAASASNTASKTPAIQPNDLNPSSPP
ncbi:hypothetical protein K9N68_10855 [Kovacikia minuta CCNUW1]|uniref:hypothetical protein n=1 Tax=Kovacikia minuta TaxID=2931930 RepID=UPI001CD016AA|nr:hypothetical protein [Kovacikia minuta]UBF28328.1 hypothetical protein K9N68_10855 [Kovacikia minuta CCNUW1]